MIAFHEEHTMFNTSKMMIQTVACLLWIMVVVLTAGSVLASDDPCKADRERYCKEVKPGQGRIADCLKGHEAELSQECKAYRESKADEIKEKSDALKKACSKDVEQFCKDVQPGQGRLARCLKEHEAELSQECKAYTAEKTGEIKQKVDTLKNACTKDVEQFCKDVQPGQGRLSTCLKEHESELSQECKALIGK